MRKIILVAATALTVLAAPAAAGAAQNHYRAELRRTTGGWAHVKANDYGSVGFGYGYAYAQDQLCELAEIMVTVNARRSRWFGPGDGNLESDFFYQRIKDMRTVQRLARRPAPHGPSKVVRQTVRGFVAGYNAYLRRTGRAKLPDPRCRGKAWVRPITVLDMYRRFYQLGLRASSANFRNEIVAAEPPPGGAARAARAPDPHAFERRLDPATLGSNAYGIGRDGARGERALVLGNPHFPWQGSERWYEIHLTIPGKLDVMGAALQGVPAVNIGFTRGVAWSHTVSTARRFTPYQLDLGAGRPARYVVDGETVAMRKRTVRVPTRGGGTRRHTFYETRWGPVFSFPLAGLTWTAEHAYALADANAGNFRLLNQWAEYDRAQSVADLRRAYRRVQGNPWVNTIAADSSGRAYYADESVIPNVDTALQTRCGSDLPIAPLLLSQGVVLLDGTRSACRWNRDRDALTRGIIGPKGLPRVTRTDYVENSNDSYWLPSARLRIGGFPRIIGGEGTQRLLRTRLGLLQAEQRLAGTDGLGAPGFNLPTLQQVMFGNRNLSAELARDATVAACRAGARADLAEACAVLAAWDGRADTGSRGAVLWREYWLRLVGSGVPWATAYDPNDPVATPSGIDTSSPKVLAALTGAVEDLRGKGIALDVPLGELQAEPRGAERIPIHGCSELEGCFNIISTDRDAQGRYDPYTGSSFVMTAAFDEGGRVRGQAILSYSQSENPRSEHYADQTRRFSQKQWLPMRFTEKQIRKDPNMLRTVLTGRR
jgi:acyl-homoserine-lactone acylase